jgi:hypothetical protein
MVESMCNPRSISPSKKLALPAALTPALRRRMSLDRNLSALSISENSKKWLLVKLTVSITTTS